MYNYFEMVNNIMINLIGKLPDKVYHGTISCYKKSLSTGIDLKKGDETVDFGKGFYTTTNYEQALSFAKRRAKGFNLLQKTMTLKNKNWVTKFTNPMIMVYNINKDCIYRFEGLNLEHPNKEWAEFVFNNRMGIDFLVSNFHNIHSSIDFVYGCMADAEIAPLMEEVRLRKISYEQFCKAIEPYDKYNQDQLSFHADKVLECLVLQDCIEL